MMSPLKDRQDSYYSLPIGSAPSKCGPSLMVPTALAHGLLENGQIKRHRISQAAMLGVCFARAQICICCIYICIQIDSCMYSYVYDLASGGGDQITCLLNSLNIVSCCACVCVCVCVCVCHAPFG